jgi:hypothetical protein
VKYHCTIDLLFGWFGLVCFANKNKKNICCHTADSKPVKQEVNSTVILPPLVFPAFGQLSLHRWPFGRLWWHHWSMLTHLIDGSQHGYVIDAYLEK